MKVVVVVVVVVEVVVVVVVEVIVVEVVVVQGRSVIFTTSATSSDAFPRSSNWTTKRLLLFTASVRAVQPDYVKKICINIYKALL
jgi:hypothetical protein